MSTPGKAGRLHDGWASWVDGAPILCSASLSGCSPLGCCLKIAAVSHREKFIRILNQSQAETVDLGGFVVQQLVRDYPVCMYRFPPGILLAPQHHITVSPAASQYCLALVYTVPHLAPSLFLGVGRRNQQDQEAAASVLGPGTLPLPIQPRLCDSASQPPRPGQWGSQPRRSPGAGLTGLG